MMLFKPALVTTLLLLSLSWPVAVAEHYDDDYRHNYFHAVFSFCDDQVAVPAGKCFESEIYESCGGSVTDIIDSKCERGVGLDYSFLYACSFDSMEQADLGSFCYTFLQVYNQYTGGVQSVCINLTYAQTSICDQEFDGNTFKNCRKLDILKLTSCDECEFNAGWVNEDFVSNVPGCGLFGTRVTDIQSGSDPECSNLPYQNRFNFRQVRDSR